MENASKGVCYKEYKQGRRFLIKIRPGQSLLENIRQIAAQEAIHNAVILSAIISAGNSGMYASTRMLYTMARTGMAPKLFAKLSDNGVPRNALYATTLIAMLCFLTSLFGDQMVYLWLMSASGLSGFIAWLGIVVSHYRFRRGYLHQGHDLKDLPYTAYFFPFGPLLAFALCLLITLGQGYEGLQAATIDWQSVMAAYLLTYGLQVSLILRKINFTGVRRWPPAIGLHLH